MHRYGMMVALLPLLTGGCVGTAVDLAAMPVRATGKVIDWSTTSRDEAYRNERRTEERRFERRSRWDRCDVHREPCEAAYHGRVYFDAVYPE